MRPTRPAPFMIPLLTAPLWALGISHIAYAQDPRDDEIFGESQPSAPAASPASPAPSSPSTSVDTTAKALIDTLQIGGRLEVRESTSQEEQQKLAKSGFSHLKQADVYFDTRPNKDLRAFLRARFSEPASAASESESEPSSETQTEVESSSVQTDIDELWLKWDWADSVFVTYGKQHLKWGSGRFWNPTDFTAVSTRDPFALFDRRLGQELLKIHIPIEKQGFNYYAVVQFDDAERNDDIGGALRGEFAFGGIGELALSAQTRRGAPLRTGLDVSSAIGPLDANVEAAFSKRQSRDFYEGKLDPAVGVLPTARKDEDKTFVQAVAGLQKTWKYSDDDNVTVGAEYFYNELGYDDRILELYALVMRQSQPLYAGRRYAGVYFNLPQPGSWNDTSFYLNGMRNLSDKTSVVRLTTSWELFTDASIEAFVSQCQGDYGELCFRIPDTFQQLAAAPTLSDEQKATLATLPTKRVRHTAGAGITIDF